MGSLIFTKRAGEDDGEDSGKAVRNASTVPAAPHLHTRPMQPLDAWGIAALCSARGIEPYEEQSDAYDSFVSESLAADGCTPDMATYELGDASIHLTSCFHRTGPNMAGTPRVILGLTYYADGATARCDVDLRTMPQGQRNDWNKFAPGVLPGERVATKLNPLLPHTRSETLRTRRSSAYLYDHV